MCASDLAQGLVISNTSFGVTLNSLMEKVERIQYQAAPAVTGV